MNASLRHPIRSTFLGRSVIALLFALGLVFASTPSDATTFNVRTQCGATGLGIDTASINRCIAQAAASPGGGIVRFPAGIYVSGSIHLMSHVTLQLDKGAIILAAQGGPGVYDVAEFNPYDAYQDFGHSHFHNALIWGENLSYIGITGEGVIDGAYNLATGASGNPAAGYADKAVSLRECDHVDLSGITIRRGGHFAVLANGVENMHISNVRVEADPLLPVLSPVNSRDGINLVNSSHVSIDGAAVIGLPDDALALKSDFALGYTKLSSDIHVSDSRFSSLNDNAIQFGSETCGNFSDISFADIVIDGAGEAGIGITSNDGSIIERVSYDRIAMSKVAVPIWIKTGNRARCPSAPQIGIIRDVSISDVTADALPSPSFQDFTSTISGLAGVPVENVTLTRVHLRVPGGHPASDANIVPPEDASYNPVDQGTKPSYGWWLRHVRNIAFIDSDVTFSRNEGRPALIAVDGDTVGVDSLRFDVGTTSPYDLGFGGASSFTIGSGTASTSGAAPRVQILP